MGSFMDTINAWTAKTEKRTTAVYARFIELLADDMITTVQYGGHLPHRTGNLMRSLLASTSGPPSTGGPGAQFAGQDIGLVTAGLKFGQDVWIGYQAIYARRMNYGFKGADSLGRVYNQEGFGFLEAALAKAPQLAAQAAAEVQAKVN